MRLPLFALSAVTSGLAHGGVPIRPRDLWHAWSFPPGVVLGLAADLHKPNSSSVRYEPRLKWMRRVRLGHASKLSAFHR